MTAKTPGATARPGGGWWPWRPRDCCRSPGFSSEEPPLDAILAELAPAADLILVEGYKTSDLPKVALAPVDAASPLPDYSHLLAWVSAWPLPTTLPVFHPRQVEEIARFIRDRLGRP